MPSSDILIKGAREHNLRDVDLVLPRNRLICLTGVSGSGKSSLAFDTLFAEGQRRYVESLSSFARQFVGQMPKPDVDLISGLSPSISISQKSAGNNPRSTVGTITEIHDYLRVLYARIGRGFCPSCNREVTAQSREQILQRILRLPNGTKLQVLAPLIRGQKGEYRDLFEDLLKQGFARARVDGEIVSLSEAPALDRQMRHDIEVVIDRISLRSGIRPRLAEAVDLALKLGKRTLVVQLEDDASGPSTEPSLAEAELPEAQGDEGSADVEDEGSGRRTRVSKSRRRGVTRTQQAKSSSAASGSRDLVFSADYACNHCELSFEPPTPQLFSFNSPQGMCQECDGLGQLFSFDPELLVPDPSLSFAKGAIEILGTWKSLGRWKRHIYQGVADTLERVHELEPGTLLETPWNELKDQWKELWLWGTGSTHITYTWRGGATPIKYGGTYEGVIPYLLSKYHQTKSKSRLKNYEQYMRTLNCPSCQGQRLNEQARFVKLKSNAPKFAEREPLSLPEVNQLAVQDASDFFGSLELDASQEIIAEEALKEIRARLGFLINVGLSYLSLDRTAPTLSGGESQRIRLAGQIGSGLVGVLYILDEPSIGLHHRDNMRLLKSLQRLRDLGNTVVVVEHDEETMWAADHIIDFGPGAGVRGGEVIAQGPPEKVSRSRKSVTGKYLSGREQIEIPTSRRTATDKRLIVRGAAHNNLRGIDVEIPLGCFVCVTGVSGSGKSSLVNDILVETLRRDLNRGEGAPGKYAAIEGIDHLDKLIAIDQTPIGRTPRSNPGTYIKVFDEIRNLFAQLPDAKKRGYKPGRFSFNVKGGRCEACEGNGSNRLEMDFLADVWVTCPVCQGHRFSRETLQVRFKGHSIADILEMDIQQAMGLFENLPKIYDKLRTLHDVGLDYLKLGQPSPTLSGGEAQRIKLARELVKRSTGQTLYLLDEPTTGLHFADVKLLLKVLHEFVQAGNTVLVVEHNLDVIKTADWVVDLGPEGGSGGGELLASGTPEEIAAVEKSYTGQALREVMRDVTERHESWIALSEASRAASAQVPQEQTTRIRVRGASQHNLREVDIDVPREKMAVFCGPSGSGKSSLAMDTIYAEGQRRYVESLSAYARQFVNQMQKPKLEHIEGLSPAIAIEQKNLGNTPRSTVGTVTEIYDYLRILMARLGTPYCPDCLRPVGTQTADQIVDKVMNEPAGARLYLLAPMEIEVGGSYDVLWDEIRAAGFTRVRIDGTTYDLDETPAIDRRRRHDVEVLVDRVVIQDSSRGRIAESVELTLSIGRGIMHVAYADEKISEARWKIARHSQHLACERCGMSLEHLAPHHFSFNSQLGWCKDCDGLGTQVGTNLEALLNDPLKSLQEGAVNLWPSLDLELSQVMLQSLSDATGLPLDVPFHQLPAQWRRLVLHGWGDQWVEVDQGKYRFQFQYKGLYPALDEASRISPTLRRRLEPFVDEIECATCGGSRLRRDAAAMRFRDLTVDDFCRQPLGTFIQTVKGWKLDRREKKIAGEVLREVENRVQFLVDVGLDYLSLSRPAASLSNGEAQRIRLASQLGSGLCGVLYVLDEPTIGLHPRDNHRLLGALHRLRDLGNTLLIVEHDREVIEQSDQIFDFGPKAGRNGGKVVAKGTPDEVAKRRASVTGPFLSGKKAIPIPSNRRPVKLPPEKEATNGVKARRKQEESTSQFGAVQSKWTPTLEVIGARHNNLKDVHLRIPLGTLTAVTGPSGCGKSSLIEDVLYRALARTMHRAATLPGAHDDILGLQHINKVIRVDQQPIGNSPASNPATYTGVFEPIRNLFAQLPDAKLRGYLPRRFSFNVAGGRCEDCGGNGQKCIEMHFLPDVWVECETCQGKRYNRETLDVKFHGFSIADVLEMTCADAAQLFKNIPKISRILQTLCDVGLDYLTLGQPAPTLSGGEAQRVKLAAELSRPDTGRTLYLLDEPTTGLHFEDLLKLLDVMHRLVDLGNTVVLIEHNLDVIKSADWVIDMGPEAGLEGGTIVVEGTPETIAELAASNTGKKRARKAARSHTADALAPILAAGPYQKRKEYDPASLSVPPEDELDLDQLGAEVKMPWEVDGRQWHTQDRLDRAGQPVHWDGRVLAKVVDRIEASGKFADTNWNSRSIVEINGPKSAAGWFFHAITAETWLLKMKFRVARSTFDRSTLMQRIPLKSLNEMDELPKYGNEPRLKCKNLHGPWQEVEIRAFELAEIDHDEFWKFIDEAIDGFFKEFEIATTNVEEHMPWKKLGEKWHLSARGFPTRRTVAWEMDVLESLFELLKEVAPDAHIVWTNQLLVNFNLPESGSTWATVLTKRSEDVVLILRSPKNAVSLGEVVDFGSDRELDATHANQDTIRLSFMTKKEVDDELFANFLRSHLQRCQEAEVSS